MAIVLSKNEKKSFLNFLLLYLGSSFLLIIAIAILYFNSVSSSLLESKKDKMRIYGSYLSAKVIQAQMTNTMLDFTNNDLYSFAMYSANYNLLFGKNIKGVEFKKRSYIKNNNLVIINQSAQLHLNVKYIVVKDEFYINALTQFRNKTIFYTILIMVLISFIGYFLSRIFLKPIYNERLNIDNFIKNTTHELNTPITALILSIDALKSDENSKTIQRIKLSSNRISNIYSDLCYLLRNDLNLKKNATQINIKQIIEEQLLLFEIYIKSKQLVLNIDCDDFDFNIDKESASRLISNIISNALKYSKPRSEVSISFKNNILVIKDNGIGIPQDKLEDITKRYFRANTSEGGFGIGLDIVNTICKEYNIQITITSKYNVGTTLTLVW